MSGVMTRILAVVSIIISFVLMSLLYGYNEQLYAALQAHCEVGGERVRTVRSSTNNTFNFNLIASGNLCKGPATYPTDPNPGLTTADSRWVTPNGTVLNWSAANTPASTTATATISAGEWHTALGLGGQFQTLTFLLIAVIPLALVAAVIAQAIPLIMSGGGAIADVVNKQTGGLLMAAAMIIAAPILFTQPAETKDALIGRASLVFDLIPLMYVLAVMGLIIWGSGLVQRFKGSKGGRGGGMMGI